MSWNTYYTLSDIEAWMSDLVTAYPDIVTEVIGGESYEGRQIKGLKISHGANKRVIFVEGGIHAREWITPSMSCYIINELLTSTDEETMAAARDFEWYIFPVTNPDGYVWTHEQVSIAKYNIKTPCKIEILKRPNCYSIDCGVKTEDQWVQHLELI